MNPDVVPDEYQTYRDPDADGTQRLKKRIIWVALTVLLILILLTIIVGLRSKFAVTGQIIIDTDSPKNSISIIESVTGDTDNYIVAHTLQDGQAANFAPGAYIVTVKGSVGMKSQVVQIVAHKTSQYDISVAGNVATLEPVADVNALSFAVGPSQIYYLDQSAQSLFEINNQNILTQLSSSPTLANAVWADASYGIAQDTGGNLYIIDNGNLEPLKFTAFAPGPTTSYAIAPNHTIYLTNGKDIYEGTPATGFTRIYTVDRLPVRLLPSDGKVALIYSPEDGPSSSKQAEPSVTIVNSGGTGATFEKSVDSDDASWSPDGKYLAVTTDSDSEIYNSSLDHVATIPYDNINNMTWLNDNSLMFSVDNQLWEFNPLNDSAGVVAAAAANHAINAIVLSPDKAYAYLAVEADAGSNSDLMIERFGLNGQQPPADISTLQANLPWLNGRCLLSLTNFASPPTIQSYGGQPEDNCLSGAMNYVQQLGINPSSLTYELTDVGPDEPDD